MSIDGVDAERRYGQELADNLTPEHLYERAWAYVVLHRALGQLDEEYRARGRGPLFEEVARCLTGSNVKPYSQMAQELGMAENAFRQQVHRCKARFAKLRDKVIADTLHNRDDLEEERESIRAALLLT